MRHPAVLLVLLASSWLIVGITTGPVKGVPTPDPMRSSSIDYLGQPPPGAMPEGFARGIVSTEATNEHMAPSFSPDGDEVFWWANRHPDDGPFLSMTMRRENGRWSAPRATTFEAIMPVFSPDGQRAYFGAFRSCPVAAQKGRSYLDIWFVERRGDAWSEPRCLDLVARDPELRQAAMPRITRDGTLYFIGYTPETRANHGIYRAELTDGEYARPELLPRSINLPPFLNWAPFIAPDESYLLFSSNRRDPDHDGGDLYVSHRQPDGSWAEPVSLGEPVNTPRQEVFPGVSPDGQYLFFCRNTPGRKNDVYWIETSSIAAFRAVLSKAAAPRMKPFACDYLNETPPGDEPVVFGQGMISVEGKNTHALAFSPDGRMLIFSRYPDRTSFCMVRGNDGWSQPERTTFTGKEATFAADAKRLFYYDRGELFWVSYGAGEFSTPIKLGAAINTSEAEYYPCITARGNLFFSRNSNWNEGRIMVARPEGDGFGEPADLGEVVNAGGASHGFVAPDERYLLFNSPRQGSFTKNDLWVSVRGGDGTWQTPVNLGSRINRDAMAVLCPTVSQDGNYLFFTRLQENGTGLLYWVSTANISALRAATNPAEQDPR